MSLAAGSESLRVTGTMSLDDIIKFRPVDLSEVVMPGFFVPFQSRIGNREPKVICLGYGLVDESLSDLIVGQQFDFPTDRLRGVRRLGVGRAKHHERRPPPTIQCVLGHASLWRGPSRHYGHDLEPLALMETFFL